MAESDGDTADTQKSIEKLMINRRTEWGTMFSDKSMKFPQQVWLVYLQ